MQVHEINHPLVKHKISLMRAADISTRAFRQLAAEVGALLTYEATKDLKTESYSFEGWCGEMTGEQIKGGPGWALQNNGIMLHCQDPKTMGKDQSFPVSLEFQLLGSGNSNGTTGNLCTPGTYITLDGEVNRNHCINCKQPAFPPGEWVTAEAEVHGGKLVKHLINGKVVFEYTDTKLDPADNDAKPLIEATGSDALTEGYISLQSESHPYEFRKIEVMELEE